MTIDEFVIKLAREAGLGESFTHHGGEPRVWIEGVDWHDELRTIEDLQSAPGGGEIVPDRQCGYTEDDLLREQEDRND